MRFYIKFRRYSGRGSCRQNSFFPEQAKTTRFDDRVLDKRFTRPTEFSGTATREEDWRSPNFTRQTKSCDRSYGSWKSDDSKSWRSSSHNPWRKEKDQSPKKSEDWRKDNSWRRSSPVPRASVPVMSVENAGSSTSLSSKIIDWPEASYRRNSPTPIKGGSIKGLSEVELEEAALLQIKLMAEMEGKLDKVDYNNERVGENNGFEDKRMLNGQEVVGERDSMGSKITVSDLQRSQTSVISKQKIETKTHQNNSHAERDVPIFKDQEPPKPNNGGLVVLKKNFEEVHMLGKNSVANDSALRNSNSKEENWYQDYLKNVNKRESEVYNRHNDLLPPSTNEMSQCRSSRYSSHSTSYLSGNRSTPCNRVEISESSRCVSVTQKEKEADLVSKSSNSIDPNQYVEELSDSEDWDEIAQLVSTPNLKRPSDSSEDQPPKRSLLGLNLDLSPPCSTISKPQLYCYDKSVTSQSSSTHHSAQIRRRSPYSSNDERYFRIEYPSMQRRNYSSQPGYEKDEPLNTAINPRNVEYRHSLITPRTIEQSRGEHQMVRSEDELGEKIDRCFADSLLKISGGIAIGIVASVAFFKSRSWPIWFGSGVGLGMGWSNCRHDLAQPYILHGKKIPVDQDAEGKTTYAILPEKL
ncbi:hypothetical protein DICVIV_07867 [Dictyocaulus viviparus]|uniref:MICOS complex subunit MIC10 n=1 Tax=Dictyocaulus viviparus TaxID=29172 RepID=A0A0D8XQM7_DICVI|nr:hypothetical protein DICVIV_07867 [Dictyocaulus viviparus]